METTASQEEEVKAPRDRVVIGSELFSNGLPAYLRDFDQSEDYDLYQSAVSEIEKLPTPPSLPGFLGKPILNAATLFKDDNSVLNMPNHTVLNHLATSSIKNNILAVSATTRYKQKVRPPSISLTFPRAHSLSPEGYTYSPGMHSDNVDRPVCHHHHIQANRDKLGGTSRRHGV